MLYLGNQKVCYAIKKPSVEREIVNGVFSMPTNNIDIIMPDNAVSIGDNALYYAYYYSTGVKSFNTNKVKNIAGDHCMHLTFSHSSIVEANMSSIEAIADKVDVMNSSFYSSTLEIFNMNGLKTLGGVLSATCGYCNNLSTINVDNIETISKAQAFNNTFRNSGFSGELHFRKLKNMSVSNPFYYTFRGCSGVILYFESLDSNSFGSQSNAFNNIFSSGSNNTIHLPSNLQSVISSWVTTSKLSGSNTTILWDLPATE